MPQPEEHYLQKEISVKHQLGKDPVRDVSDFIERVNGYVQERGKPDQFCVYRGEPECYPTPCRPNLFRRGVLAENRFFEKNLFDAMRQNKLTGEKRYLDNAIDAQHGEFPSRLLDVSYNCLVALYFAVTPYYHTEENSLDREDGMVFLFFLDEIFSPSARNTNDNYRAIIDRKPAWCQKPLFQKNIKFIDHTKLNPRIIAQQGAFMLFQGDEAEELPKRMFCGIRIPKEAKPKLRSQLKNLFGIHTGTIYPEISNLVRELTHKSRQLNTQAFTCENELYYALAQLERELDFYLDYALTQQRETRPEPDGEVRQKIMEQNLAHIEWVIRGYRDGLLRFCSRFREEKEVWKAEITEEQLQAVLRAYNEQLEDFSRRAAQYSLGEFLGEELKISGV